MFLGVLDEFFVDPLRNCCVQPIFISDVFVGGIEYLAAAFLHLGISCERREKSAHTR
jgi:hypothetical protein